MPRPRDLAKVHSMRPTRAIPKTSRLRCCSNDGVHGTRLKPSPSVDHGKAAGREVETLAIDTGDNVAVSSRMIGQAGIRGHAGGCLIELPPPKRVQQVAGEDDALPLMAGEVLADQVFGTRVHGLLNLEAKAARTERPGLPREQLTVEPGGAGRFHLRGERQVGPNRNCGAVPAPRVLESPQLDDRARRAVAGGIQVRQADVVGPSIRAVDDRVGRAPELIIKTARDEPPDDRPGRVRLFEDIVAETAFDPQLGEPSVDTLDDIAALAEHPQGRLGTFRQIPSGRSERLGQPEALKLAHAPDQGRPDVPVQGVIGLGPEIDDAIMARGLGRKGTIEPGPTVSVDLCAEAAANLEVISWSEFKGDKVTRTGAQSLADVVPRNDEVAPVVRDTTDNDVNVGIIGIPMFSTDPVELCSKVPFRLSHQVARKGFQVGKLRRVLRGHDKAEMMAIALTPLGECFVIGAVLLTVKYPPRSIVLRDALAA